MRILSTGTRGTQDDEPSNDQPTYYVLGGGNVGTSTARLLHAAGHAVHVVDETHDPAELPGRRGDPRDVRLLEALELDETATVVVATPDDGRNLLVAGLVRARFDVADVVVLVNDPERCDTIDAAGHRTVCATSTLSAGIVADVAATDVEPLA